jgi:hypothetical protein
VVNETGRRITSLGGYPYSPGGDLRDRPPFTRERVPSRLAFPGVPIAPARDDQQTEQDGADADCDDAGHPDPERPDAVCEELDPDEREDEILEAGDPRESILKEGLVHRPRFEGVAENGILDAPPVERRERAEKIIRFRVVKLATNLI